MERPTKWGLSGASDSHILVGLQHQLFGGSCEGFVPLMPSYADVFVGVTAGVTPIHAIRGPLVWDPTP
jgi:hypothetical protein